MRGDADGGPEAGPSAARPLGTTTRRRDSAELLAPTNAPLATYGSLAEEVEHAVAQLVRPLPEQPVAAVLNEASRCPRPAAWSSPDLPS